MWGGGSLAAQARVVEVTATNIAREDLSGPGKAETPYINNQRAAVI
jgi:hypothetical protein